MDYRAFFSRKSEVVARDLLGRMLVRKGEDYIIGGQIIETGAYEGDLESSQRRGMNYTAGRLFLMPFRGNYLLNIATEREGKPSCVEIRGLRFKGKNINGSALIAATLNIGYDLNDSRFESELKLSGKSIDILHIKKTKSTLPNCLGYFNLIIN